MTVLYRAPEPHRHELPLGERAESRYPVNSVARCEGCGVRFVVRDGSYGPVWTPLRWYHRKALRGMRAGRA